MFYDKKMKNTHIKKNMKKPSQKWMFDYRCLNKNISPVWARGRPAWKLKSLSCNWFCPGEMSSSEGVESLANRRQQKRSTNILSKRSSLRDQEKHGQNMAKSRSDVFERMRNFHYLQPHRKSTPPRPTCHCSWRKTPAIGDFAG